MPVRKRVWAKTPFWVKSLYAAAAVVWTAVLALAAWQKQSVEPEILEQDMPHRMSEFAAEVPVQDGPEFVLESAADTPAYIDCAPLEPTAQECAAICAAYETSPARKIVFGENGRVDYTDAAVGADRGSADAERALELAEAFLRMGGLLPESGYTRTLSYVRADEEAGCLVFFVPVYKGVPLLAEEYGARLIVKQDGVAEMSCRWPVFSDGTMFEPKENARAAQQAYLAYMEEQGRTPGAKVVYRRVYWYEDIGRVGQTAWMFGDGELFNNSVVMDSQTLEILSAAK